MRRCMAVAARLSDPGKILIWSGSSVVIFKPHNVVFTQITSRLHFDNLQRDGAGVGETMGFTQRNVRGLVFGEKYSLFAAGDFSRTPDHDPMLSAVMMHLEAQARLGMNLDTLDLEAAAVINAIVPTPGTMHLAVLTVLFL